jgi:hypothetical protein
MTAETHFRASRWPNLNTRPATLSPVLDTRNMMAFVDNEAHKLSAGIRGPSTNKFRRKT